MYDSQNTFFHLAYSVTFSILVIHVYLILSLINSCSFLCKTGFTSLYLHSLLQVLEIKQGLTRHDHGS